MLHHRKAGADVTSLGIAPDEREFSDLVDFAYRLSAEVRYFDLSGQSTGDWRPLLASLLIPGTDRVRRSVLIRDGTIRSNQDIRLV